MADTPTPAWSAASAQEQLTVAKRNNDLLQQQVDLLKSGQAGAKSNATSLNDRLSGLRGEMAAGGSGGFAKMGKLAGVIELATSALQSLSTRAVLAADSVFAMYNSGVVMRMDQLSASAGAFGLDLEGLTKLLTKHGQTVSVMGINRTTALGDAFRRLTVNGTELGMSLDQSNEVLMTYADMMNKSGRLRAMTDTQVADGARDFALQLNEAAQATGKNVEQIKQEIADRQSMPDISFLFLHMTEAQKKQMDMTLANTANYGEAGKLMYDKIALLKTTGGSYSGLAKDDPFLNALNSTQKELFRQISLATDPAQQEQLFRQFAESIKMDPLALSQAIAGSQNKMSTEIQGMIVRDVLSAKPTDTTTGAAGGAPPDETAKLIKDTEAQVVTALNAADTAFTNMAVTAAESVLPAMSGVIESANELATEFASLTSTLIGNPITPETMSTFGELGVAAAAALATLTAFNVAGGAGGAGINAAKAEQTAIANRAQGKATAIAIGGYIAEQMGALASSMGYNRTGAGVQAGGEIVTDAAIGRILGSLLKIPGVGTALGIGYGIYNQSDNIQTAIGTGAAPAESATAPATAESVVNPDLGVATVATVTPEQQMENQTTAIVSPLEEMAVQSSLNVKQNNVMLDTMTEVLTQLKELNTAITDQTTALRNAFSRGSGNVYP